MSDKLRQFDLGDGKIAIGTSDEIVDALGGSGGQIDDRTRERLLTRFGITRAQLDALLAAELKDT